MQLGLRVLSDVCFLQTTIMQEPRPRGTTTEEKQMPWNMYVALPKTLGQIVTQDTLIQPTAQPPGQDLFRSAIQVSLLPP